MTGIHARIVAERKEHRADGRHERLVIAAGQIGPSDRAGKERVADEQIFSGLSFLANLQTHAARAVTRRVIGTRFAVAERDRLPLGVEAVDPRQALDAQSEHRALLRGGLVEKEIVAMQVHGHVERTLRCGDAGHMIDMRVGQKNVPDVERLLLDERQQPVHFVSRIDQNGLACRGTRDDEAVLEEGTDRLRFNYDHFVILAILDDLLFTSKIKTAAGQLRVPVKFARSSEGALTEMRSAAPSLVILDLNSQRTDPLGTVAKMKADPLLAAVPTIGFVSHVQTDTIEAARQAGVDEVLARSAFTMRLGDILTRA